MEKDIRLPNPENGPGITVIVARQLSRKGKPYTDIVLLLRHQEVGVYETEIGKIGISRIDPAHYTFSAMNIELDCSECKPLQGTKGVMKRVIPIQPDGWGYCQIDPGTRLKVKGRHAITNSEDYESRTLPIPDAYKRAFPDWKPERNSPWDRDPDEIERERLWEEKRREWRADDSPYG